MAPDKEAQHANRENREDHRAITEDWLARERGKDMRRRAHARQNRDVNFRMAKEPEQMLPKQRRSAVVQRHWRSANIQVPGNEETRTGDAIQQQQNAAAEQNRK